MLRFIVDTQLSPKLSKHLSRLGADSIHTIKLGNGHLLEDATIREIAKREKRIVVTKDSDFRDHFFVKGTPPKVLLITIGNTPNQVLLDLISNNYSQIEKLFNDGAGMVVLGHSQLKGYIQ